MNNASPCAEPATHAAVQIAVTGRVQGVGFRPAMARLAGELALAGEISNTSTGVEITVEGEPAVINSFLGRMAGASPALASIAAVEVVALEPVGRCGFRIESGRTHQPLQTPIPLDLVVCHACLGDVQSPENRRASYPYTSCPNCGPRYSILASLPYERAATAMSTFPLCQSCRDEYERPSDRRFHAETIACWACGPDCRLINSLRQEVAVGREAIQAAVAALRQGQIVALRGIGGYQLLADATNRSAVQRLRERKQRPARPLAILVDSLATAKSLAQIDAAAAFALAQPSGPIVVVLARQVSPLATEIHPGLTDVGLMLPTSPLHWQIARDCPPLVATSGNREGQPLAFEIADAHHDLAQVADLFLDHNRPIHRPIDDSVVKMIGGKSVTLRAARGIAPLPLELHRPSAAVQGTCIVALGGQQNNAIAIWNGHQAALGPHVGNLDELGTCERWHAHRRNFCELMGSEPALVVHDMHPDYYPTRWAMESRLPRIAIQHHHAHVAAAMLEHGWLDRQVLGVAWDGTGLGPDQTIWGGEFLRATAARFDRVARLRPFPLLGGEMAIREPWRIALALLVETFGTHKTADFFANRGWNERRVSQSIALLNRPHLSPQTSSLGRLFDAVATIVLPFDGAWGVAQYEGQLAMQLESACAWPAPAPSCAGQFAQLEPYPFPLVAGEPAELDWRPLLTAIVADSYRGVSPATIARRFHAALATAISTVAAAYTDLPVVLCGGVFQNRVLTEMTLQEFSARPQPLGVPGLLPPGDGGLAAGQLVVALAQLNEGANHLLVPAR